MDVTFASRGKVRAEVEKAPWPSDAWWRARVVGGRRWRVPTLLPWSYGPSESTAFHGALALWVSAGQPGLEGTPGETTTLGRVPTAQLKIATRAYQANATIVTAGPDTPAKEHQVTETVEETVRVVAAALDRDVPILTLTSEVGSTSAIAIGSVVEVRGPKSEDRPETERPGSDEAGPSGCARADRSESPEAPAPEEPTSTGAVREPRARSD